MLDLVEAAASASDTDLNVEVIDDAFLTAQGIENELPLWTDDPDWVAWARVDVSKAIGAGLTFRPIEDTVAATLAHTEVVSGVGLEPGTRGGAARRLARSLSAGAAPGSGEQGLLEQERFSPMITIVTTTAARSSSGD